MVPTASPLSRSSEIPLPRGELQPHANELDAALRIGQLRPGFTTKFPQVQQTNATFRWQFVRPPHFSIPRKP